MEQNAFANACRSHGSSRLTEEEKKRVMDALRLKEAQDSARSPKRPLPRKKFCVIIKKD